MTRAELAEELGLKESYVANHWQRIKANHEKINIFIYKNGRGDKANYGIRNYGDEHVRWEPRKRNPQ